MPPHQLDLLAGRSAAGSIIVISEEFGQTSVSETGKIAFLQRRDPWGHGFPLWIVAAVVFVLPVMMWALRDIEMHNDVAGWLPKDDPQARLLSWYETMFPSEARVLVSWDSCSLTDPRLEKLQEALEGTRSAAGQIEGGSPYVEDVTLPAEVLQRMMRGDVTFEDSLRQIDGLLIGQGPLKIRYSDAGRIRGAAFMQNEILALLKTQFGITAEVVEGNLPLPTEPNRPLEDTDAWKVHDELTRYVQAIPLYDLQISWTEMRSKHSPLPAVKKALLAMTAPASGAETAGKPCIEDCFETHGAIAAASIAFTEAGAAEKQQALEAVRQAMADIGIPAHTVHMGGQPVVNVALNEAVGEAAWNTKHPVWDLIHRSPILLSALVSIALSFVMLQSVRLATLVQSVSFLTVVVSVALIPMTGGSMNMVLIVMPTLLAVLTTSAAIHLCNYWKHSGESDPAQSVFAAARTAWLPCALAAGTTSIGLASLMVSNLVPVRDFGIYSAIGCGLSFLIVLYVLPSLMLYWPRVPPGGAELRTVHWARFGMWLAAHRHVVCCGCVVLTATVGWGLWNFKTETKVIRYFPEESQLVQDYTFLEDKLSGVISIDTIVRFDEESQRSMTFIERARIVHDLQLEVRDHQEISGVLSLASFLDLRDSSSEEMSRVERMKLNSKHRSIEKKIRDRLAANDPEDSLNSMLAIPDYSTDWYTDGDHLLNRKGDEIWRVTAQASVLSDLDLEILIGDMNSIAQKHLSLVGSPNTGHVVTGLIPVFLRTQQAVLESLIRSFGMAFFIIAIVMMVLLRSSLAGVITMLPNLMPVILVFGWLSWMNLKVDIGTMITASVALGIAVDGTLHLITWFQELVRRGIPVEEAVGKALAHCGPAMWQTSAAVGLGMLALWPAELLLVSRFGWIMAALIFSALVADVVFLPALLGGALGHLIRNAALKQSDSDDNDGAAAMESETDASHVGEKGKAFPSAMEPAASSSLRPT